MTDLVIQIENLAKIYKLGVVGTGTISHDLNRWWYRIRGKEDPYLKIGEANDRSVDGNSDYVWAIKDIDLEVNRGEVLGIIGKNGAGKSTLLKILSQVTGPTTGSIKVKGRIGTLLEVGTGFHPELTGRENIFLNGAILGMTKPEIKAKLDEIIDFSGTNKYIDTPVKRYSSGMKVRLGFAVAAHLEAEILVIDEVLAVGDAEFQNKAIGKMNEVSDSSGKTILFVSHNMASVKKLCTRAIVLKEGRIDYSGSTDGAVDYYLNKKKSGKEILPVIDREILNNSYEGVVDKHSFIELHRISILNSNFKPQSRFSSTEKINIKFDFKIKFVVPDLRIVVSIVDSDNKAVLTSQLTDTVNLEKSLRPGNYSAVCTFPEDLFATKHYYITVQIVNPKKEHYIYSGIAQFEVQYESQKYIYAPFDNTYFRPNLKWQLDKKDNKILKTN